MSCLDLVAFKTVARSFRSEHKACGRSFSRARRGLNQDAQKLLDGRRELLGRKVQEGPRAQ